MLKAILNFLFPQKCVGCRKGNEVLCDECVERIDHADLPAQDDIFAASNYSDSVLRKTIWLLKYKKVKIAAPPLAGLLRQRVWDKIKTEDALVVPIPLSKKRLRQRGFNQSELIARHLSDKVKTDILYKKVHTDSQVSIKDKEKRLTNLAGSFEVKNPEIIMGRNIILIDDVCTTGATIKEAKKVLKDAGARRVVAVVVARG